MARIIMRIELSSDAKRKFENIPDGLGMTQLAVTSKARRMVPESKRGTTGIGFGAVSRRRCAGYYYNGIEAVRFRCQEADPSQEPGHSLSWALITSASGSVYSHIGLSPRAGIAEQIGFIPEGCELSSSLLPVA